MPTYADDEMARAPILHDAERVDDELSEQLTGCGATACCNPSHTLHRFIALIFMCLLGFGSYFCYDNPSALQDYIMTDLSLSNAEYNMLYSFYSWPNVFLCFIGGFLIDRVFGIRLGTIIYMVIVVIGQLIFAFGALTDSFAIMVFGRLIFGIGAESLAVAQNNYAVVWFKGKELNMVFGLQLSFARVGSTVNFLVMEPVYKYVKQFYQGYECMGVVLFLAALTCVMSMICALILGWMDKRSQRILRRNDNPTGEIAKLSDITTFKVSFWMVSVVCVAYYVAIFPFIANGKMFFETVFHFEAGPANTITSIVYIISAFASPLFGFIVDKTGRNVNWVLVSIVTTIGAHSMLGYTKCDPYVGMTIMGLSYSMLASSLWPLVALIIPEYQLGTAYGICQSVQNLGLAVVTIIAGLIVDNYGYMWLETFFVICLIVSLLATFVIHIHNTKSEGILNMTPEERDSRFHTLLVNAKLLNSDSIEEIEPSDVQNNAESDPTIRNRYLKRIGVDPNLSASDCEPLLD